MYACINEQLCIHKLATQYIFTLSHFNVHNLLTQPIQISILSDPSLTVENLAPVIALVEPTKWEEVWSDLLPKSHLKVGADINQQSCASAKYYINYGFNPSWKKVYGQLYAYNQTSAMQKVKPFLHSILPGW